MDKPERYDMHTLRYAVAHHHTYSQAQKVLSLHRLSRHHTKAVDNPFEPASY
jgi:hypothetical protein